MSAIKQIVLLHGWGCDGRIWQPVLPLFHPYADTKIMNIHYCVEGNKQTANELCQTIADQVPAGSVLCGWSLGGMLATRIAALYPEKILGLITLASNAVFVANEQWRHAMPVDTFEPFFLLFKKKPQQALKRFMLLEVHGDKQSKEQLSFLKALFDEVDEADLACGLELLESINNINLFKKIACAALFCFGENDALVPSQAADSMALGVNIKQKVAVIPDSGHLLHYPGDRLAALLKSFLVELRSSDE